MVPHKDSVQIIAAKIAELRAKLEATDDIDKKEHLLKEIALWEDTVVVYRLSCPTCTEE